jgi:membrane-associated protein
MDLVKQALDIVLHLNDHLDGWAKEYSTGVYLILFLIVFCETGLVVTPFLPGDSLLFAVGAIAARGSLNIWVVALVLVGQPKLLGRPDGGAGIGPSLSQAD